MPDVDIKIGSYVVATEDINDIKLIQRVIDYLKKHS